ncbi:MAG: hypothetical protein RJA81_54 [Planctomycetota bacterium]
MIPREPVKVPSGVLLAVDWGRKRVGLAVCDSTQSMVFPLKMMPRNGDQADSAALSKAIRENGAKAIIVGWPLLASGLSGQNGPEIIKWVEVVLKDSLPDVYFADERFTSVLADETLRESGRKASQRKHLIDSMAAREFLQDVIKGAVRIWPFGTNPPALEL